MITEWNKISEQEERVGFRRLLRRVFRLPDGREDEFTVLKEGRVVCVLALTPENKVILAKQFRPGPEKVLRELPGGGVEKDESPEEAAKRELKEETGYEGEIRFVSTSFQSAYSTMVRYNFLATNCKKIEEAKGDGNEWIETELVSLDEFRDLLRSGELTDMGTGYRLLDASGLL